MNSMKTVGIVFIILLISCNAPEKDSGKITEIEVQAALSEKEQIKLSEFIARLDYIRLETTTDGLVRPNSRVIITDNYIITISSRQCLLFERQSGKFIREVGKYGRGPNEYAVATVGFVIENQSVIYFMGWDNRLIGYSFNGNFIGTITVPATESDFGLGNLSYLNDSVFVDKFKSVRHRCQLLVP